MFNKERQKLKLIQNKRFKEEIGSLTCAEKD